MTTAPLSASGWIAIATLLRPQGRRGELLAEPLSDLVDIFAAGREVLVVAPDGAGRVPTPDMRVPDMRVPDMRVPDMRVIDEHWFPTGKNAGRVVLKLSGCESIGDAEALAGRQVMVPAGAMPVLAADTFFVGDLVGCAFFDGEAQVGTIVDVEFATGPDGRTRLEDAAPLLGVALTAAAEGAEAVLVPFVRAWLETVDVAGRRVVMHLPAGLLEGADGQEDDGPEG